MLETVWQEVVGCLLNLNVSALGNMRETGLVGNALRTFLNPGCFTGIYESKLLAILIGVQEASIYVSSPQ